MENVSIFNFPDDILIAADSRRIFRAVLLEISLLENADKPEYSLAKLLKVDERTIENYRKNKTPLSPEQWMDIAQVHPWVKRWYNLKFR